VGVDWAEDHHDVCVMAEDGTVLGKHRVPDSVAGIGELHALIAAHAVDDDDVVAVGIEIDRDLLVGSLVSAGYDVYAVNPMGSDGLAVLDIAPTLSSGEACLVRRSPRPCAGAAGPARFARNRRLADACDQWAFCALTKSPGARHYYDELRARGKTHRQALRQLANRLVGLLHVCLERDVLYDELAAWPSASADAA